MRLFYAINFSMEVKTELRETVQSLRAQCLSGSFTQMENLHLTLVFLGETQHLQAARDAMDGIVASPFLLKLDGIGRFPRNEGDIYWMGVQPHESLTFVQQELTESVIAHGFSVDKRPYKPHLTLGRRVKPGPGFDRQAFSGEVQPLEVTVDKLSLMESVRLEGKLVYREIWTKALEE